MILFLNILLEDTCSDVIQKSENVHPKEEMAFSLLLLSLGYCLLCTGLASVDLCYLSSCAHLTFLKVMENAGR